MTTKAELLEWMKTSPPIELELPAGIAFTLAALVRMAIQQNEFDSPDVGSIAEQFLAQIEATLPPHLHGVLDRVAVPLRGWKIPETSTN